MINIQNLFIIIYYNENCDLLLKINFLLIYVFRRKVFSEYVFYLTQITRVYSYFIEVSRNSRIKKLLFISCPIIHDSRRDLQQNVNVIYFIITVYSTFFLRRINRTRIFRSLGAAVRIHYVNSIAREIATVKVSCTAIISTIITSSQQLRTTDHLRRRRFMRNRSVDIRFHYMIDAISRYYH